MAEKYRKTKVAAIKLNQPDMWLEIDVAYNKGGNQTWGGHENHRGYYLHVTPVEIKDGFRTIRMQPGAAGGSKALIEEVKSFSQKKMDGHAGAVLDLAICVELVRLVTNAGGFTIAKGERFSE